MCTPNTLQALLNETTAGLRDIFGEKLDSVILYGSYARGDYRPYSDVDIMLISSLPDKEIRAQNTQISEIVGEMCIEHDVTISVSVRSMDQFKPQSLPYHKSIVTEGIRYNPGGFNA